MKSLPPLEPQIVALLERRHGAGSLAGIERMLLEGGESETGARLERLVLPGTLDGAVRYVVKRLHPQGDWVGRATNDERMREYRLAVGGIYRALPEGVGSAVVEAIELDNGAALLMHDVSPALAPPGDIPLTDEQLTRSLRALARLHSAFFGFPARLTAGLGLCVPAHWLTLFSPATAEQERDAVPHGVQAGWEAFARLAPDAWHVVGPLLANPAPLVQALRNCPDTIVHGNATAANLTFDRERVLLLDWSQTMRAPAALDLGWYLAINATRLPLCHEDAIEIYRQARAEFGRLPSSGEPWERERVLALLAGTMRHGWAIALGVTEHGDRARAELDRWVAAALSARHWLDR